MSQLVAVAAESKEVARFEAELRALADCANVVHHSGRPDDATGQAVGAQGVFSEEVGPHLAPLGVIASGRGVAPVSGPLPDLLFPALLGPALVGFAVARPVSGELMATGPAADLERGIRHDGVPCGEGSSCRHRHSGQA